MGGEEPSRTGEERSDTRSLAEHHLCEPSWDAWLCDVSRFGMKLRCSWVGDCSDGLCDGADVSLGGTARVVLTLALQYTN